MNIISPKPRSKAAENRARSRANLKALEKAGLTKFPTGVCPKLETMEAFYDVGERLGTDEPAEILNAVFLTLHERPSFISFIKKYLLNSCPRDISAARAGLKYPVPAMNRMMDEGND